MEVLAHQTQDQVPYLLSQGANQDPRIPQLKPQACQAFP